MACVDILEFLRDSHASDKFLRGAYASFIALVPKSEESQGWDYYRPISLVGYMYKIIG